MIVFSIFCFGYNVNYVKIVQFCGRLSFMFAIQITIKTGKIYNYAKNREKWSKTWEKW